jgi:hypothetical protein
MTFTVDERLGYLLSPALAAYEAERVQGAPYTPHRPLPSPSQQLQPPSHFVSFSRYGNAEFQSSIRRFVPEGHTFKAFPFSATHSSAAQLLEQCLLSPIGRDILATPGGGDLARFGVRLMVKVRAAPRASWCGMQRAHSLAELCRGLPLHLAHGGRHVRLSSRANNTFISHVPAVAASHFHTGTGLRNNCKGQIL